MSRILLVDDALDDQRIISSSLGKTNEVRIASTVAEARKCIAEEDFDLILLDVQLPDGDGFKFCAELQSEDATRSVPVIFLTVRSETPDKVMGFSLGAEDYVSKPFDAKELRARVEARIKKASERRTRELTLQLGDLKISVSLQKVYYTGGGKEQALDLTPLEFKLLFYFAQHEDHVFSREQLLAAIWTDNVNVLDRTVDMHVSNLRKKLVPSSWTIRSVHGVGYRFAKNSERAVLQ
jgi:DNA-binding response OmpR family regulator